MPNTFFDLRQSILRSTPGMIGNSANLGADVLFSNIDSEVGKLFEDRNAMLKDGGQITFTGTQLQFTQNLVLELTQRTTGALPTSFSLGSASVTLANGDTWIATLNRTSNTVVTSVILSGVPLSAANFTNQDIFVIAARRDSADGTQTVYFRSGMSLTAGSTARLGAAGSGSGTGSINYLTNPNAEVNTNGWNLYSDNQTVTITNASPAVFTVTSTTGFYVSMPIAFTTTGSLPTGLTSGTTYYISNILTLTQFRVSATIGGADVNTSSAGSGTHTARPLVPVTASGGSVTGLAFTRTTSLPLRGTGSFLATQSNSTVVAGQGISTDFTIDNEDQAHVLSVQIDFNASSTFIASSGQTGSESDFEIFIKDLTNSILIPVSPKVITANGANNYTFKGTFQTASNSTSYRLCIHAATTNANATGWTFKFDNVMVGPQVILQGPPVTDWQQYSLTVTATISNPTFGTVTANKAYYRRFGDCVQIRWTFRQTTAGTAGSGTYLFSMPPGLNYDTTKLVSDGSSVPGVFGAAFFGSGNAGTASVETSIGTTNQFVLTNAAGTFSSTSSGTDIFSGAQASIGLEATIPVTGWSSTTLMSNDTDTRVVSADVARVAAYTATSNTPVAFDTILDDTHGAFNTSTGLYTCPVSGIYRISTSLQLGASPTSILVAKNGASYIQIVDVTSSGNNFGGSTKIPCVAGDTLAIWLGIGRPLNVGSAPYISTASFERLSGPSAISATETVSASYYLSANFAASTTIPVNFDTKEFDSHNAVTTSATAWRFTAPSSGLYHIGSGNIELSGGATSGIEMYKNGSLYRQIGIVNAGVNANASSLIRLIAGDFIDIRPTGSVTFTGGVLTNSNTSAIQILRVGN